MTGKGILEEQSPRNLLGFVYAEDCNPLGDRLSRDAAGSGGVLDGQNMPGQFAVVELAVLGFDDGIGREDQPECSVITDQIVIESVDFHTAPGEGFSHGYSSVLGRIDQRGGGVGRIPAGDSHARIHLYMIYEISIGSGDKVYYAVVVVSDGDALGTALFVCVGDTDYGSFKREEFKKIIHTISYLFHIIPIVYVKLRGSDNGSSPGLGMPAA